MRDNNTMREKIISSSSCYLSSLEYSDMELIKKWRNEQIAVLRQSKPLTSHNQEEYWKRISNSNKEILFSIVNVDGKFIGYCGFTNIDSISARAELSFLLDTEIIEGSEEYLTLFEDVLRMLLQYGFERLHHNRLVSETHCFRDKHLAVLEKVGFVKEGVLRNHVYKKNKFHDSILHSVLREEYYSQEKSEIVKEIRNIKDDIQCIKAIIFDFDDALVDEESWIHKRWEKTIIFAEEELGLTNFGKFFWQVYTDKGSKYKFHVNDVLTKLNQDQSYVKSIVDNFLTQKVDEKLLPGVLEYLQSVHGKYKLGIVTNGKHDIQLDRIKNVGINTYFDVIVCAYETPKPNKQPYLDCAAQLGVFPHDCVYISHDIDIDLFGAKNAGFSTILLDFHNINNDKDLLHSHVVDGIVRSYKEIEQYFIQHPDNDIHTKNNKEEIIMEQKGILIVGAGVLQKVAVEKAKELGYYVYITDMNIESEAAKLADEAFAISTKDIGAHVELAKRLKAENKIVAVYTQGCDVEYTVAMAAHAAGLPGIDPEAALNCNDKVKMRTVLNEKNVDYVKFGSAKTVEEALNAVQKVGYPCIIKPLDNSASRGVKVLRDGTTDQEIVAAFDDAMKFCFMRKEAIIEQFFEGDEYSVDTVMYKGKLFPAGVSDRQFRPVQEYSVQVGSLTPSLLPEKMQADMYTLMEKAATALGVDNGAFKGDLIIVDGKPRIIEVTARTSGGFDSQYRKPYSLGIDIVKATIDIAAGKEMDPRDLVSRWMKWSKTTSVFPEPGIIRNIKGLEEIENMPGVRNIFHSMKIGDEVKDYRNCASRINHIIIVADTFDELNKLEDKVHETLQIETEPIGNVHQ